MPTLVILIIGESCCTLVFEILFWSSLSKSHFIVFIYSVAIGGEVGLKSISLWLFGIKYLKSCLELPTYYKDRYG